MTGTRDVPDLIADRLRLTGFLPSERDWVVLRLAPLGARLWSFVDAGIELAIGLADRNGADQRVTLECWLGRTPRLRLVSTSTAREMAAALNEVRDDLVRQVDDVRRSAGGAG